MRLYHQIFGKGRSVRFKTDRKPAFAFHINEWKQAFLQDIFHEYEFIFVPFDVYKDFAKAQRWNSIVSRFPKAKCFIWGLNIPDFLDKLPNERLFVEDGFFRSVRLGSDHSLPHSLVFDKRTLYFDSREPSDLEVILNNYDFKGDKKLLKRAEIYIKLIIEEGLSKYNNAMPSVQNNIYGIKNRKRILVIGQVEDDASIIYGSKKHYSNNDLVEIAREENPDADIYYKPHPDVAAHKRSNLSDPSNVSHLCNILGGDSPISEALESIDHLYTITSQVGFEALLRDIKVTCLGAPFYSGWGLTDDRQPEGRRSRNLTTLELFAGACLLYPRYFSPVYKTEVDFDKAIRDLLSKRNYYRKHKQHQSSVPYTTNRVHSKSVPAVISRQSKLKKNDLPWFASRIPDWINCDLSDFSRSLLEASQETVFWVPWIAGHTQKLISQIENALQTPLHPLEFVSSDVLNSGGDIRREIARFARNSPDVFKKLVRAYLLKIKPIVKCVIFTYDWSPYMKIISTTCGEIGIKRLLVPHEGVWADESMYYKCVTSFSSMPTCDYILAWGDLQREALINKGFPSDRITIVGSPKLEAARAYKPSVSKEDFFKYYGLDSEIKTIFYAAQPLDSQYQQQEAQSAQKKVIETLIQFSEDKGCQLIIRLPPSGHNIMPNDFHIQAMSSNLVVVDYPVFGTLPPEDSCYYSDVTISINSTMLLEAILMGRAAISTKFIKFPEFWEKIGMVTVRDQEELLYELGIVVQSTDYPTSVDLSIAAQLFGRGDFESKSISLIVDFLDNHIDGILAQNSSLRRIMDDEGRVDILAIPSSKGTLSGTQRYIADLLSVNSVIGTPRLRDGQYVQILNKPEISGVDVFAQWGIKMTQAKHSQKIISTRMGLPTIYIEDGFIRSCGLGVSGEPTLSLVLDDCTSYYDCYGNSRMERILNSRRDLSNYVETAGQAIEMIVSTKTSKYNHVAYNSIKIGRKGVSKILLVDQRYGDQSVLSGMADEHSFKQMLEDAISDFPDHDIIVKQHPDAIKGGYRSYFNQEFMAPYLEKYDNLYTLYDDINPYALFEVVDAVFVVTSGMGFEALLAEKKVTCYGMPFYAGWGVTKDRITNSRRSQKRSIVEIFIVSYLLLSRYYSPELEQKCSIFETVDYIVKNRGW